VLERQIDQAERRETLRNDLKVRQQQEERPRVFAEDQSLPNRERHFINTHWPTRTFPEVDLLRSKLRP
jgi:hypothetical protein